MKSTKSHRVSDDFGVGEQELSFVTLILLILETKFGDEIWFQTSYPNSPTNSPWNKESKQGFGGWSWPSGNMLFIGEYWNLLKSRGELCAHGFPKVQTKKHLNKVQFLSFSILFAECFYPYSVLRYWNTLQFQIIGGVLIKGEVRQIT